MPTYCLRNRDTGEEWEEFFSMAGLEQYLRENQNVEQFIGHAPALCDPVTVGVRSKPDSGFRDLLKDMKRKHSRGLSRSTINTF